MLASSHFGINRTGADDWFDTILDADTELFVDPFLIFQESSNPWDDAHDQIIEHFNHAFMLIAKGNRKSESLPYKKALDLLIFTEPSELCLGYTSTGTAGLGSGHGYADIIAAAISDAIRRGVEHPSHFEELGILHEGIGADRISDITCTILKARLVEYTAEIAERHGIPTDRHRLYGAAFDQRRLRFMASEVQVPTNPFTEGPLLFVPQRFLRRLPVLNADDWWTHYENEQLRRDLNYEVLGNVSKKTIVATARANPESVREWTEQREAESADPYDFDKDPKGVWLWDSATVAFATANPLELKHPTTDEGFLDVIETIVNQFGLFVEEQGGWQLLWNDTGKEKPESAAQLLFRGIAQSYCRANNISLDAEVNLGRGPVDFKFSRGHEWRAHLEVKKVHNGKFWDGLGAQLPSYMGSDEVVDGWLLAIRYFDKGVSESRVKNLPRRVREVSRAKKLRIRYGIVDARPKRSASKLRA